MTDVIGLKYEKAFEVLKAQGYNVDCVITQANNKKRELEKTGVYADIVVRQKEKGPKNIELIINNMRIKN